MVITMDIKQEQRLIHAAQQGDEHAFGALYDAYADTIYRHIFYRVNSPETAQDLTSEVFLRMVEGLPGYEDRGLPFMSWLYRIAHARLVDYYQQSKRMGESLDIESVDLTMGADMEDDLDGALMSTHRQQRVREALRLLTNEQQQVLILRFLEGYNLQKTAGILGKTVGAVKVMQHRALQALNRMLVEQGVTSDQGR
jgi:RNA polymerase sigma-70 factor (ECF subfamily)